ncbi:MAG: transcriptional regulator [Betaproteobacteria bacterium]|nr:transcriptional regulator [Betaproteobacteria bacterium]
MEFKPIRTKKDHQAALAEAERLWDAPAKSPKADWLEMLTLLIEDYEHKHFPIPDPDPIEFLNHIMESRGLTRKDMEVYIGPRGRVADILNRTRPLTLEMIRRLADGLNLPAEVLVKPYPLRRQVKELAAA